MDCVRNKEQTIKYSKKPWNTIAKRVSKTDLFAKVTFFLDCPVFKAKQLE